MQALAVEIEDGKFRYTQIERSGKLAIYRQTLKASDVSRFEVIRIHDQKAHIWPGGIATPDKEAYPSSRAWGQQGWTFFSLETARKKLQDLQEKL